MKISSEAPSCGPPPPGSTTVVGSQFVAPYPLELVMTKKYSLGCLNSFVVTNLNGNVLHKVKKKGVFSRTMVVIDKDGNLIVSLRPKTFSFHGTWRVYKGNSSDPRDLVFTIKDSPFFPFKRRHNVFLAHNTDQKVPDFIVKPSWFEFSCTIYSGDNSHSSNNIIAQMDKKYSFMNTIKGKEILEVTVNPNVDYSFIVTLVVALYEKWRSNNSGGGGGAC